MSGRMLFVHDRSIRLIDLLRYTFGPETLALSFWSHVRSLENYQWRNGVAPDEALAQLNARRARGNRSRRWLGVSEMTDAELRRVYLSAVPPSLMKELVTDLLAESPKNDSTCSALEKMSAAEIAQRLLVLYRTRRTDTSSWFPRTGNASGGRSGPARGHQAPWERAAADQTHRRVLPRRGTHQRSHGRPEAWRTLATARACPASLHDIWRRTAGRRTEGARASGSSGGRKQQPQPPEEDLPGAPL